MQSFNLIETNTPITLELIDWCLENNFTINLKTGDVSPVYHPVKGRNNKGLIKQIYELYIKGDLYPAKYVKVFGILDGQRLTYYFKTSGFERLSKSRLLELYKDQIVQRHRDTAIANYGVDNPAKSPEIRKKIQETNRRKIEAGFVVKRRKQSKEELREIHRKIQSAKYPEHPGRFEILQHYREMLANPPTDKSKYNQLKNEVREFIYENYKPSRALSLAKELGVYKRQVSSLEIKVKDILIDLCYNYKHHYRKFRNDQGNVFEVDFFFTRFKHCD